VRLLLVTNDYPPRPGGIQQYLASLVAAFPGEVRVLGPADGPARDEHRVARNRARFMWPTPAVSSWAIEEGRRFGPDAVLVGAPYPLPYLAPRLRRELGVPVGVLCHGAEITIPAALPGLRSLVAAGMRRADVVFATSRYTAGRVERMTRGTVARIGAGVDLDQFRPAADPPHHPVPVVGCVSRFVPRKGQHRLLEAAAVLTERGIAVQVVLVGRGRTEARLRRLAGDLGVAARFEVDVPWDRLGDLYREMDVFAMPCRSRWAGLEIEGLGLVYLEAAATGLPVLAGDSGGAAETVLPGRSGFVVHSTGDLVEGLAMLLGDEERARRMGEEGRRWMEAEWTWDKVAERLVAGFVAAGAVSGG
jgi:phosphatidyl-myo-inositol dimannoside synthase